jgi:hypothetical protein
MASDGDILQTAIIGIPRVAEKIVRLPRQQRQKAFEAVEQSYLQTVMHSHCGKDDAKHFVGAVMDTLRAEVAYQFQEETQPTTVHDNFQSLQRIMKLLVNSGSATATATD